MASLKKSYKYYYIYKTFNLINKRCYVGFHATDKEYEYDYYYGSGKLLKRAIKKYEIKNFIKGVIEYIDFQEWREKEIYWIKKMHSHISEGGYNLTRGGEGSLGRKHTKKSIIKMKKYIRTEEHKKHLKENRAHLFGEKNGMFGKKHKKKSINKMKKAKQNISQETRDKLRKSKKGKPNYKLRGRIRSKEHCENIRKSKLNMSQETHDKIKNNTRIAMQKPEIREKIRIGLKKREKLTCPICHKTMDPSNFKKYKHGDNCKNKRL